MLTITPDLAPRKRERGGAKGEGAKGERGQRGQGQGSGEQRRDGAHLNGSDHRLSPRVVVE